mgnify:CR=1 FL=1
MPKKHNVVIHSDSGKGLLQEIGDAIVDAIKKS